MVRRGELQSPARIERAVYKCKRTQLRVSCLPRGIQLQAGGGVRKRVAAQGYAAGVERADRVFEWRQRVPGMQLLFNLAPVRIY